MNNLTEFIQNVLLEAGSFAPRGFSGGATVYRARMRGTFVGTLVNGVEEEVAFSAQPGRNRYDELLRWLGQLTGHEQAFCFYINESPDGSASLVWLRQARKLMDDMPLHQPLATFESEPPQAGGGTHLGLIGENHSWLLLHTYYPDQEFEISIHGSTKLCNDLCRLTKSSSSGFESP